MWNPTYDPANNNRYQSGGGISYDANGNLLSDTFNTYTWHPNWGNPATINGSSNPLVYDALGRMVENTTSSGTREYLYAPGGSRVLAQMNGQTPVTVQYPLPGGGLAIYNSSAALTYARPDWLGGSRLVTNSSQSWVNDSAYAPFGEQYATKNIGFTGFYHFTGQQQWTVSSGTAALDDFLFRKYHPVQGRWLVPDPAGLGAVDITNPQTWNRYAYLVNNPLNATDPLGLYDCEDDPDAPGCNGGGWGGGGGGGVGGCDPTDYGMGSVPCTSNGQIYGGWGGGSVAGGYGGYGCGDPSYASAHPLGCGLVGLGDPVGFGGGSGGGETLGIPGGLSMGSWYSSAVPNKPELPLGRELLVRRC